MTTTTSSQHVRIAIVGTGFSGLGTGIRLKEAGIEDFAILERASDVGGTWRDNTYPGCQCDVPSHLYSFSFAPNPDWTRTYSKQAEIWDYLRDVTDRHGIRRFIRFDHDVTGARWDEEEKLWRLETSQGELTCEILIAGTGALVEPSIPDILGLDSFEGEVFHSARWNHDYDLEGKRVASIGTGASAIQYVPEIQPKVEQLHVFQRTPPWILRHTDRPITKLERWLYRRIPRLQRLTRAGVYAGREWLVLGFVKNQRLMKRIQKLAEAHLRRQVKDPELREKLRPSYIFGCKRILPTNRWYPALQKPNVELVTEGIVEVKPNAVVSADGREREVDAIILGTGFHVTDMPMTQHIRGRDGRLMSEQFEAEGTEGYLGTVIKNFPNLFFLTGPNTGLGHTSMVYMIESQIRYLVDALRTMEREGIATVEVRPEVQAEFNRELQGRMKDTVWMRGGCASWYIDDQGRNSTLWPDWTFRFRQRTSRFDLPSYITTPVREREPVAA